MEGLCSRTTCLEGCNRSDESQVDECQHQHGEGNRLEVFVLAVRPGGLTAQSHHDHLEQDVGIEEDDHAEVEAEVDEGTHIGAFVVIGDIVAGVGTTSPAEVSSPLQTFSSQQSVSCLVCLVSRLSRRSHIMGSQRHLGKVSKIPPQ